MADGGGRTKRCAIGVNAPMNNSRDARALHAGGTSFNRARSRSADSRDRPVARLPVWPARAHLHVPPHGHLPLGCATYDEALTRYFPIDEKVRRGETLPPSDLQFLLELRDYLNACAEPATGASVAFTTLVMRKLPEARKGKADAERAYPEWIRPARFLSSTMMAMLCLAVTITLMIAAFGAYIYIGNSKIANIAEINARIT